MKMLLTVEYPPDPPGVPGGPGGPGGPGMLKAKNIDKLIILLLWQIITCHVLWNFPPTFSTYLLYAQ